MNLRFTYFTTLQPSFQNSKTQNSKTQVFVQQSKQHKNHTKIKVCTTKQTAQKAKS
jgi:hypothetical protein